MSGVVGLISNEPVNQVIYDALLLLQHRGQNSAGIATVEGLQFHLHKGLGLVNAVFRTRDMRNLVGNSGVGHCRYPTCATASSNEESSPFYVNAPYGILYCHEGNLTNAEALRDELYDEDLRHINTVGDGEILLNVVADEISRHCSGRGQFNPERLFAAMRSVYSRVRGAFADVALIINKGLVAFRDPHGIRPLCIGRLKKADGTYDYMVASESVALNGLGFEFMRDVAPGEVVFISRDRELFSAVCAEKTDLCPCIFEHVYIARPDSVLDGVSVYAARLTLGEKLAARVRSKINPADIDVVMPIPDSGRPAAQQLAAALKLPYREGFLKNRYVGRTFIMPGQSMRVKTVRQKLNGMPVEFEGKAVLLVDDSIVRGTTMCEIVKLAREAGARKVFVASTAPRVMFPNVYGIDMTTRDELICGHGLDEDGVAKVVGADAVVYQDLEDLKDAIIQLNPAVKHYDCSCFDGRYITGDVDEAYLQHVESLRKKETAQECSTNNGE